MNERNNKNSQFIKRTNIIFIVCNKQRNIISPLAQSHDGKTTRKRYYISIFSHHFYLIPQLVRLQDPLTKQYSTRASARNRPVSTFLLLHGYISNKIKAKPVDSFRIAALSTISRRLGNDHEKTTYSLHVAMRYISNNALTWEKKKENTKNDWFQRLINLLLYSNVYSPVSSNRDWGLLVTVTRLPFIIYH